METAEDQKWVAPPLSDTVSGDQETEEDRPACFIRMMPAPRK